MQPYNTSQFTNIISRFKWTIIELLTPLVENFDLRIGDIVTQICFLTGLSGIGSVGIIFAIPYLYTGYSQSVVLYLQGFGVFLILQMLMNWLCMKFVDTKYQPYRDGSMPTGISIGQNISRISEADDVDRYGGILRWRIDSASLNIMADNRGSVMYVATDVPKSVNELPERKQFPYLSWSPCVQCNRPRPPRCHHCPICATCVLKRDHHCYFAGACIGSRNLRHFTVFVFWALVATLFASLHAVPFYYYDVLPYTSYFDLFFPLAITRASLGYIDVIFACYIVLGWLLLLFLLIANTYLKVLVNCISTGKTSFEMDFDIKLTDTRSKGEKLKAVFGCYWMLNFLVPLHFLYDPIDDAVKWPSIKS